jgi:DNA-binding beta-propeller fold protein YncE
LESIRLEYLGGAVNHYLVLQTPGVEADGLALDQQGNLYVAYRTSPVGPGSIDEFAPFATEGTVLGMTLNQPQGVIVDNSGNVVTVETGGTNRIDVFPPGSQTASLELPMPQGNTPTQLAIDSKEKFLYVSSFTSSAVFRAAYPLPNELLLKDTAMPRIQGTTISNNQAP